MSSLVCAGMWLEDDFECPLLSLSILSLEPEPLTAQPTISARLVS